VFLFPVPKGGERNGWCRTCRTGTPVLSEEITSVHMIKEPSILLHLELFFWRTDKELPPPVKKRSGNCNVRDLVQFLYPVRIKNRPVPAEDRIQIRLSKIYQRILPYFYIENILPEVGIDIVCAATN
jgi:hypothetical protein